MARYKALGEADIRHFREHGFTYLRGGFSRAIAEPVLALIWATLDADKGLRRDDPATWTTERVAPSKNPTGPEVAALYTPRVRDAFDDLLGAGRWVERGDRTGAWPIIMPGFQKGPWKSRGDWHIDGGGQRTLRGPSQALIAIMLFSDVGAGQGGTAVRVGSHRTSAAVLRDAEPEGLQHGAFITAGAAASKGLPEIETDGELGDLVLCHGYLVHSGSTNGGTQPRIITNNCITLQAPAVLDRSDPEDLSVYEHTLLDVLQAPSSQADSR